MLSRGIAATSLTSGGCSGLIPKSKFFQDRYPAKIWQASSNVCDCCLVESASSPARRASRQRTLPAHRLRRHPSDLILAMCLRMMKYRALASPSKTYHKTLPIPAAEWAIVSYPKRKRALSGDLRPLDPTVPFSQASQRTLESDKVIGAKDSHWKPNNRSGCARRAAW